jgi:hypothetical protein
VAAARAQGITLAAWILTHLDSAAPLIFPPAGWRMLDPEEIPQAGDKARLESGEWETISIPSMWLAGNSRISGSSFCRKI